MNYKLFWGLWAAIFFGIGVFGFAWIESRALRDPNGITLSQTIVDMIYAWPPIVFLAGLVLGILLGMLTTHFLWHWVPRQKRVICGICSKRIIGEGDWP